MKYKQTGSFYNESNSHPDDIDDRKDEYKPIETMAIMAIGDLSGSQLVCRVKEVRALESKYRKAISDVKVLRDALEIILGEYQGRDIFTICEEYNKNQKIALKALQSIEQP